LTEIADASSDTQWAKDGPGCSPAALERLAAQKRRVSREDAEPIPTAPTPADHQLMHRLGLKAA
jgi:hypothetical protein